MHDFLNATGAWWSYAEGDPTVVGVVVAVLSAAAIAFVGNRAFARARRRR